MGDSGTPDSWHQNTGVGLCIVKSIISSHLSPILIVSPFYDTPKQVETRRFVGKQEKNADE